MKLSNFIKGLEILSEYFDKKDGYHIGAEHDVFYVYATDRPLKPDDFQAMIILGWFQEDVDTNGEDFSIKDYDQEEGWACFT